MNRPSYHLNEEYKEGDKEFPRWTSIQPIDEKFLPPHLIEKLDEARKYSQEKWKICIIGVSWVPVKCKHITERR